jgi:DNA-binding NtrC family response regulator
MILDSTSSLLVVASANPSAWRRIKEALDDRYAVSYSVDLTGTLDVVERHRPALVVLCGPLLDADPQRARSELRKKVPGIQLVLVGSEAPTRLDEMERYVEDDKVPGTLLNVVRGLLDGGAARKRARPKDISDNPVYRKMVIGDSPEVQRLMDLAERLASVDVNVLINGESGTGKELLARWIHCSSPRAAGPFETVDLPSIPDHLFESILFGHERGSFTGAVASNQGKFQKADTGTLFLDEVSSLKLELQPKLLRAIQEKEVECVGAKRPVSCDVRIIAATNQDLEAGVSRGEFRSDLYYRLNTVPLNLVPLRRRKEDIPALVAFFAETYAERFNCRAPDLPAATCEALQRHGWPGNIRELENRVQRALLVSRGDQLQAGDFFDGGPKVLEAEEPGVRFGECSHSLASVEQLYISRVIEATGGNQTQAAQILQISRKTLRNKLQSYAQSESDSDVVLRSVS